MKNKPDKDCDHKHINLSDIDARIDKLTEEWDSSCEVFYEYYCGSISDGADSVVNRIGRTNTAFYNAPDSKKDAVMGLLVMKYEIEHKKDKESKESEKDEEVYRDVAIERLLKIFNKWMYIGNPWDITIPVAYALSNFTKADPGCLAIIAPSGSYKTELIRSFGEVKNEFVYPLNSFTSHTFISGMPKVPDIVDELDKRLILVQDFTTVLSKAADESRAIFTNIREALNGYMDGHFGSGKNVEYTDIHSSFLIASTDELEAAYSLNAVLGQRMIFYKPRNDPRKAMERAEQNMDYSNEMREEMHNAMIGFLATKKKEEERLNNYKRGLTPEASEMLSEYTTLTAIARTHVKRNMKGFIMKTPSPEFPTRLKKEIIKVVGCHAVVYDREVCEEDLQVGLRLLLDNIPDDRVRLLRKLAEEPISGFNTSELSSTLSLGAYTAKQQLDELMMVGLVYRETTGGGNKGDRWRIVPEYRAVVQHFLDFDINLAMGVNRGGYIQLSKKVFLYDKLAVYSGTNVYSNNNSDTNNKEEKEDKVISVYTIPDIPLSLEKCSSCDEIKPHMSSYNEKLYCDNCLEDAIKAEEAEERLKENELQKEQKSLEDKPQQGSTENVCSACGSDINTTLYNGEWLCSNCLTDYADNLKECNSIRQEAFDEDFQIRQDKEAAERLGVAE